MKSNQRMEHKIISYKPYKYLISNRDNKENISQINSQQNREIKNVIKPSISSNNCRLKKNIIDITPIKRNNSNTKIVSTHPIINDNNLEENNNNKRKYIFNIIDRRQNFMENKNSIQQRYPSISNITQIQEKKENITRDKSFDLGHTYSRTKINIDMNKYNISKNTPNYKIINKIPISNITNNNNEYQKKSDRGNFYNISNTIPNSNEQERLFTEPKNVSIYISGSSNKYTNAKIRKNEVIQGQKPIQHNRMYSMTTGGREDLNKIENKILSGNNKIQDDINKKQENKTLYTNYVINSNRYNKNNIIEEENKLRKSYDNIKSKNENYNIKETNNKKRNHYIYESKKKKNEKKDDSKKIINDKDINMKSDMKNNYKVQISNTSERASEDNIRNRYTNKQNNQNKVNDIKSQTKYNIEKNLAQGNYKRNKTPIKSSNINDKTEEKKFSLSNIKRAEKSKSPDKTSTTNQKFICNINKDSKNYYKNSIINVNNNYKRSSDNVTKNSNIQNNYRRNNILESNRNVNNIKNKINIIKNNNSNISTYSSSNTRKYIIPERKVINGINKNTFIKNPMYSSFTNEKTYKLRNLKYSNITKEMNDKNNTCKMIQKNSQYNNTTNQSNYNRDRNINSYLNNKNYNSKTNYNQDKTNFITNQSSTRNRNILNNINLNSRTQNIKIEQTNNYNYNKVLTDKNNNNANKQNNYVIQNNNVNTNNSTFNRGNNISNNNSIYCVVYKNKPKEKKIQNEQINNNTKIYSISHSNNYSSNNYNNKINQRNDLDKEINNEKEINEEMEVEEEIEEEEEEQSYEIEEVEDGEQIGSDDEEEQINDKDEENNRKNQEEIYDMFEEGEDMNHYENENEEDNYNDSGEESEYNNEGEIENIQTKNKKNDNDNEKSPQKKEKEELNENEIIKKSGVLNEKKIKEDNLEKEEICEKNRENKNCIEKEEKK